MTGIMQMLIGAVKAVVPQNLYTWASGLDGRLGTNSVAPSSSPTQVGSVEWLKVSTGYNGTIAIRKDNQRVYTWGSNFFGQLGNSSSTLINRSSPVTVGTQTWAEVAQGTYSNYGIRTNGTLWAWGSNSIGQLGISSKVNQDSPVQIGALTTWTKVYGGFQNGMALKNDGTLWTWGANADGQLGQNNRIPRSSPVLVIDGYTWAEASIGGNNPLVLGITTTGELYSWGHGRFGELGINISNTDRSRPTQIGTSSYWATCSASENSGAAIRTNGTLWTWGANGYGSLALNISGGFRSSPTQVGTLTNWAKVSQGHSISGGIKTDGTLWMWGGDFSQYYGVGDNTTINRSSPVQVGAGETWKEISCGTYSDLQAAAITGSLD